MGFSSQFALQKSQIAGVSDGSFNRWLGEADHIERGTIVTLLLATADLSDAFETCCSSCETQLKQYGGRKIFWGRIRTVKCLNDNVLLRRALETRSEGDVLVVDGSGSLSSALMGDMIAGMAAKNGWSGAVIFGAVRDSRVLASLDFGISALGTNPRRSAKMGAGSVDVVVAFGGATFTPGHWVYVDEDGILVSAQKLVGV